MLLIAVHTEASEDEKRVEEFFKAAQAEDICSTTEATVPAAKESRRSM